MSKLVGLRVIMLASAFAFACQMASAQVMFYDDFTSLNPVVWGDPAPLPARVPLYDADIAFWGPPQTAYATTLDGRTVLYADSYMGRWSRRGWGTKEAFSLRTAHIAVDFKTIGGPHDSIDGLLELWLVEPTTRHFVAVGIWGGVYGTARIVWGYSGLDGHELSGSTQYPARQWWEYGGWYRYVVEAGLSRTRVSLRTLDDSEIWGHTFNFGLPSMGTSFRLNLIQHMGWPDSTWYHAIAAIDRITLSAATVSSIRPARGTDTGSVTATILGFGLLSGTTAKLSRAGQPDILGSATSVSPEGGTLTTTFDLRGRAPGVWDVVLNLPDGRVLRLPAAFTIEQGQAVTPTVEVFNAPGGQRDWISPGSIAVLVAPGLAKGLQGCVSPKNPISPLPLELANVTVAFGESWAPIYSVCNLEGQESVTIQVPFEVPPVNVLLRIRVRGSEISKLVNILEISPGVFEWRMRDGRSRPVMLRPDNSFVSVDNPARRGETIRVYAVGLGRLSAPVGTNQTGSASLDARTVLPVVVGVNNAGVEPLYAAYAPNLIGVYEVAFVVPADTPAGDDVRFALAVYVPSGLVFANSSTFPVR